MSADKTASTWTGERAGSRNGRAHDALVELADRVGARIVARTIFGEPVERDGITVVPVASARFGLGGGSGSDPSKAQEGSGAGAAGTLTPAGYIELKDGASRFVPVVQPARMMLGMLAGIAVVAPAIIRALSERGAKSRGRRR